MAHVLEAKDLAQTPGQERFLKPLFEQVSFRWESPAMHVIMGHSGGGKSTFLKTLGGVWKPARGQVYFDGKPMWGRTLPIQDLEILKHLGFAFQNNALFSSLRVIDNLTFPYLQIHPETPRTQAIQLAEDWLERVGLSASAQVYPHELSGGMQKRLSLARTLILEPRFVFLDDPTAGLDPMTSKEIADLLKNLVSSQERIVVIVTNDPDRAIEWGPHIHFLHQGQLVSPSSSSEPSKSIEAYQHMREIFL